ncbi:MAG: glycosyltransferase family 4 protein [Candidatus Fermentibacteraceae bacterium]|nr:glycosyltransferase family 4 protein [Candidatus Fermentibacteraceae bacterium]
MFTTPATGASKRAYELHRRMPPDLGFTAFVTGGFSKEWKREFPDFQFVEVCGSRSFLRRLREGSSSFWRKLLDEHGCGLWVTDTLPVPSRPGNVRTCITVHDLRYLESWRYVSLRRFILLKAFMGRSLARADSVVAVSSWTGGQLEERYALSGSKLSVIGNAVDPDRFGTEGADGEHFQRPYLLSVGHLERRKNIRTLVEAFGKIADRWDGYLVLVGRDQGSLGSIKAAARKYGVRERLMIRQGLDFDRLVQLYRNCEAVVCPSEYEGFGLTPLEGMAAGRPVVASDIPPHREVAGEAALYADPKDAGGFAASILKVIEDRSVSDVLVESGRERVRMFSWQRSAEKLVSLYRELLGR